MRQVLLSALVIFWSSGAFAQQAKQPTGTMSMDFKTATTGQEKAKKKSKSAQYQIPRTQGRSSSSMLANADTLGTSTYDLQTNNSLCRRIFNIGNGKIIAGWTRSVTFDVAASDRGTGYNYFDGSNWGSTPVARIESQRVGWPNLGVTRSGREFSIAHTVSSGLNFVYRNTVGTGSWTDFVIQGDPVAIWPRYAIKGDTIIVITSRQTGNSFNGVDGGLAMFRSWDQGDNWTGPDSIPGTNAANFSRIGGDAYAIDMNDNIISIVVGIFQVSLFQSSDYGDTWTKTIILTASDPLFTGQVGETLDTMVTGDESYTVLVDNNDVTHVWYGRNVVWDNDPATMGWTYQPYNNGLMYWNDNMTSDPVWIQQTRIANDTLETIDDCAAAFPTANEDATQAYFGNVTSMPQAGMDASGNLYVSFSALRDGAMDGNGANYRSIYLIKSMDGGNTWIGPYNVGQSPNTESVYPHIARLVDTHVHMIFQQDDQVGTAVQDGLGPAHTFEHNQQVYVKVAVGDIVDPVDITCPTIAVPGDTVETFQFCLFDPAQSDQTVFADDIPEGDISSKVKYLPGNLDVSTLNVYTVQYYVLDGAGNSSDTVSRFVEVVQDNDP
ncbi:MAG: hypothetical protein IH946_05175, partial [Bacteroidetes bacterium]|nr:hypothetical protein [Bacteroidota bacterium]